ncbi:hypothetical protein BKA83DRAFT_4131264 [Pisolithus microcarpus]|nr:hypothetical protein BKA83DRAFT_4131264 [Pisolithus microcarpus]
MLRQPSHNTGLDISSTNLSALIALIMNLELNAVDAETLANILYLRSRHHAYSASSGSQPIYPTAVTYPSNPAALSGLSRKECSPPLSPSTSILADFPTPPVSICLMPPNSSDPTTVLVRGSSDRDAKPAIWLLPDCTYAQIIIVTREMPLDCKGAPGISSHGLWPSGSSALRGTRFARVIGFWQPVNGISRGYVLTNVGLGETLQARAQGDWCPLAVTSQNAWSVAAAPNVRGLVPLMPLEGLELSGVRSVTSSGNSFSLTALGWGLLLSMRIQPAVEGLELSVLVLTPWTTMKTTCRVARLMPIAL